ncbi:O-acyltransferase like protein [Salvelinus fontinalis]|uniref:O-acyltransferase like protein n=1 Tax=Salvelinus fontinalis TaxID=8038 RepID=UPI00248652A6|nr:O-acyltransferase like protein [Salvelinus fontinalis]
MVLLWRASCLVHCLTLCSLAVYSMNVSEKCTQDTRTFLSELNKDLPSEYAALMYDAFGKMGSDVVGGNVNRPGSLQECLSVQGPSFTGQYCQVFLKQDPIQYFVGICVPDSCVEEEVQTLVVYETFQQARTSLIPPVPSTLLAQSTQGLFMTQCLSHTGAPDLSVVTCLFVCCALVAVPLTATLFVAIVRWQRNREVGPGVESSSLKTRDPNLYGTLISNGTSSGGGSNSCSGQLDSQMEQYTEEEEEEGEEDGSKKSCMYSWLQAFSFQACSQEVLSTASPGGGYSSLNGIRIFSLLWIICGHTVQLSAWNNLDNDKRWKETVEKNPLHVFAFSGPVYLAVDTFLLLGGLLSARSLLGSIQRAEDKLSPGLVANFLFKRFKRVQPLHLFIVCLAIGLFSVVQRGAFWFIAEDEIINCKKYWWSNLLLVNNLFTITDICAPWTWYLSLDFQFYATTPLLIYLYRLNKGVLVGVASALLFLSSLTSAVLTALLHLPVHQPTTLKYENYFQYYYNKPYTRYGPYLIGILAGISMTTKKGHLLKHQWQAAVGWFCCLSVMAILVGLAYVLRDVPPQPSAPHALYQGIHRSLWALAVAWIILACEEGYGGFVDNLLSLNLWVPLSNISFACYLIHPVLIILYNGKQETPIHYTDMNFFYLFLGHMILTVVIGYVLTVLVEKPYLFLKGNKA